MQLMLLWNAWCKQNVEFSLGFEETLEADRLQFLIEKSVDKILAVIEHEELTGLSKSSWLQNYPELYRCAEVALAKGYS